MHTAKITLTQSNSFVPSDYGLVDDFLVLLYALRKNGQILGDNFPIISDINSVSTLVMLPNIHALDAKFHNKYVTAEINKFGTENIHFEIVGQPTGNLTCELNSPSFLILFTNFLAIETPIHNGDTFEVIPLYYLPKNQHGNYEDILRWEDNYKACDSLQISCQVGEKWADKQLANVNSELSQQGLKVCQDLFRATTIPVYYYLHKHFARSYKSELARKCPKCGGEWLLEKPLHRIFDFKCDNCHLLSNIAFDVRRER